MLPTTGSPALSPFALLVVAVGLAMDAFAVALATSLALGSVDRRQTVRLSWHFGLFQGGMPALGWLAGRTVSHMIAPLDHWIAFGLLALVGGRAVRDSLADPGARPIRGDPTRGASLIMLSIATSIDALAVGLGLALLDVPPWQACLVIGVTAAILTFAGTRVGHRVGAKFGKRVEILGGLLLIGIGVWILYDHLSAAAGPNRP